jgi:formylglycine-generating enzyme required for sulfatase activity
MQGNECAGCDCCASEFVPGGDFLMGSDGLFPENEKPEHPVKVSRFRLDIFEVTVGRFRRFVDAYTGVPPAAEAAAHPNIPGSGWRQSWNTQLPATRELLVSRLTCTDVPGLSTFTPLPAATDSKPMNCVSWYVALAFCIWDGGRLPTEAEWEFTAAKGDHNAPYPWGFSNYSTSLAILDCSAVGLSGTCAPDDLRSVGSRPAGHGRWNHLDLAGSVSEPVLDVYSSEFYGSPASLNPDPANLEGSPFRVYRGGGFGDAPFTARSSARTAVADTSVSTGRGVRCARNL